MPIADIFWRAGSCGQYSGAATANGALAVQRTIAGLALLPPRRPRIRDGRWRMLRSGPGRIGLGSYGEFLGAGVGQSIGYAFKPKPISVNGPFYNLSRDAIDEVGSFRSLFPTGFDVELPHVGLAVAQIDQGQSHATPRLRIRLNGLEELSADALPARGFANEQFGNISFRSLQEKIG